MEKVELLGYDGTIEFEQDFQGLEVIIPSTKPNAIAPVFKITFKAEQRSAYELLQEMATQMEENLPLLASITHPYNTGKPNTAKLDQLRTAIENAKAVPATASEEEAIAARQALAEAYNLFEKDGLNKGGAFNGVIEDNITTQYLIEASNFTRSAGGSSRFGKPMYWTVENFSIPNGNDGTKQGLDKYSGNEALMLGVWNDAGNNNSGSLENARIYRKVTMPAGKYYFGAAYNTTYNINQQAYMFVSTKLSETVDIPTEAIAYYPISSCSGDLRIEGLYFQLDQETEVYIGFQANLLNGSATQEFRAERVALYTPKEVGERHAEANGWQLIDAMPEDVSQYFFAIYDHGTDNGLVLGTGNKQGTSYKTMWYEDDVYPEGNKDALWTFDCFDSSNNSGAKMDDTAEMKWIVITCAGYPDNCLHSFDAPNNWQYRTENNGEGWTDRAYVSAVYVNDTAPSGYWKINNNKGGTLGRYDGTAEITGDATAENIGHYDIYSILRGNYVAAAENIAKASEENPIDISYVITNADATRKNNFHSNQPVGWTLSRSDAFECEFSSYLPSKVGNSYFNKWQGSGNLTDRTMSQQLSGLPNGKYRVNVVSHSNVIHAGAWLFANNDKADMTKLTNNTASVTTEVTDGKLTLGVELKSYTSNDCKFDHFTLEYLGGDNTATGINDVNRTSTGNNRYYDLQGRSIIQPKANGGAPSLKSGLYIIDGKKVIIR